MYWPAMRFFTSLHTLLAIVLAGRTFSTSRAGVADAAATVILEPLVRNPGDFTFAITSIINVANNPTNARYDDDAFPMDLYSSDTIEFVLQPPPGANEMSLSSFAPGEAMEVNFRASLVDGPNIQKCQNSAANAKEEDNIFNGLMFGASFKASVTGRDADMLSQAFAWERSYVSIENYGCVVESRLLFQPTEDDGIIQATIEKITWSAQYELSSIGVVAGKSVSLFEPGANGLMIRGGDVSFHTDADVEKKMIQEGMGTAKGDMYPSVSLAGLLSKTPRAQIEARTITLEPWVPSSDYSFVVTSNLNVAGSNSEERRGNQLFIDLHSSDRIEFVLQPPAGANEMMLLSSTPGEAIEIIFRASLVNGPNVDKCHTITTEMERKDDESDQRMIGDLNKASSVGKDADALPQALARGQSNLKATITGRDADMLSQALAWERSYVSIEKYGCVVESRLLFQPTEHDGIIQATIEKITWSAQYDVSLIGGVDDGSASLYELKAEGSGKGSGLMIRGGDVLFDIVENNKGTAMAAEKSPTSDGRHNTFACFSSFGLSALMIILYSLPLF